MNKPFNKYLDRVREQLECNATEEYKKDNIIYSYSNEQIDDNFEYFVKCHKNNLSEYKSLLFFGDYLEGDYDI